MRRKAGGMQVLEFVERLFLTWALYSCIGWIWETGLSIVVRRRFVDRGVLIGPLCPIYGFGALLVLFLLNDVTNPVALFLSSGVVACTLEYISSYVIEKLHHVRLWDYSNKPFNINGRVYLNGFIAFGAGATLVKLFVQPWFMGIVRQWTPLALHIVCGVIAVLLIVDVSLTAAYSWSFDTKLKRISEDVNAVHAEQVANLDEKVVTASERLEERRRAVLDSHVSHTLNWQQRRLMQAFPAMRSVRDNAIIDQLRESMEGLRSSRRTRDTQHGSDESRVDK